ncbi:MAG: hypothetical protein LBG43_01780 [Treponema sp.]|jgi:hypothetical protein|nr:hypothetical protein [Treponema sp.]
MKTRFITKVPLLAAASAFFLVSCVSKESALEEAPIITSATYQHTQYNGRNQAVEVHAAKDDAPPFVITYFASEEDLEEDRNGSAEAPVEVGDYYVRIERPGGNGYTRGRNVKVEYHIQKAFISIAADPIQRFAYDGEPKQAEASVDPPVEPPLIFTYFAADTGAVLLSPPAAEGVYRVAVVFPGNKCYMGASTEITLLIE